jgi:transketolase
MASGSELMLSLQTACSLKSDFGIKCNVVSVPCFDLLCEQDQDYIDTIIKPNTTVIAIEAATALEYYKFADHVIGMDDFGKSGPAGELFEIFGFTIKKLKNKIKKLLG